MAFISGGKLENATGGTISTIGGYKVHTFDTVGLNTFTPTTNGLIEVLVVGGGAAGSAQTGGSGGGGGGSVLYTKVVRVSAGVAYTMNVGAGGINGNLGTDSVINLPTGTVTAFSGDVGIGSFGKTIFSSVPSSINEGASGTFNVTTDKIPNGTTLFWTINHIGTVNVDFDAISGSFVVNNDAGTFSVPIAHDQLIDGSETFTVSIRSDSPSGTILSTSPVVSIVDRTLVTTASQTIFQEGQSVTFTTQAQGFANGTTLYYDIIGSAGITAADFTSNSLSGTYTVSAGVASTTLTASIDAVENPEETFRLGVKTSAGGSILAYSPTITISEKFDSFTFTNAGLAGFAGPTLANLLSSYNTTLYPWLLNTNKFNVVTQGLQLWTVPIDGYYTFTVAGASGGNTGSLGGTGRKFTTNPILLTRTHIIRIVAGQVGQTTIDSVGAGGGGGSVVYNETTSSLIAIAGGGGGAGLNNGGVPAPSSTSGASGLLGPGSVIGNGGSGGSAGGQGGPSVCGFSAAGWNEDGVLGNSGCGRISDFNAKSLSGPAIGGDNENTVGSGGFGGGGGGATGNGYGGGGGGFSGGGGGGFPGGGGGGGGGSFSSNGQNTITTNTGGGSVVVTYIQ